MTSEIEFLQNYKPDTLYVIPGREGAYARLVGQNEEPIAEIEITERSRIAISAFYINSKADYGTFKITKLRYQTRDGWSEDGSVSCTHFDMARMKAFVSIFASLNLRDASKSRVSLSEVSIDALSTLLESSRGAELIRELSAAPGLREDIYAVASKRKALETFETYLSSDISEKRWQLFFEENTWIFGHGLNYVFLDKVSEKLETTTTGAMFDSAGKRVDALMRTRAEVSQFVLVEIKRNNTPLLEAKEYRGGCWNVSSELSGAIAQIQKNGFRVLKDSVS